MDCKQNKKNNQGYVSLQNLVAELPNFIAITVSAIFSSSLIAWMDFIDSFSNIINHVIVIILSRKLKKNLNFEYNYGSGKIEAFATLLCEIIVICGVINVIAYSIIDLFSLKKPSDFLIFVVMLKVINVSMDVYFFRQQVKLKKQSNTLIGSTMHQIAIKNLAFDSLVLVMLLIAYLLRNNPYIGYFTPIVSILLAIYFLVTSIRRSSKLIQQLTDKTISEKEQLLILEATLKHFNDYENVNHILSRYSGNIAIIEFDFEFSEETTYGKIVDFLEKLTKDVQLLIPNSQISFTIKSKQDVQN